MDCKEECCEAKVGVRSHEGAGPSVSVTGAMDTYNKYALDPKVTPTLDVRRSCSARGKDQRGGQLLLPPEERQKAAWTPGLLQLPQQASAALVADMTVG